MQEFNQNQSDIVQIHTDSSANKNKFKSFRFFVFVVISSLIFGGFGGALGTYYLFSQPFGQKLLAKSEQIANEKVDFAENSAIINVVKKSGPAVVSIVISKSQAAANQDLFFNLFFYGSGNNLTDQQSQPNVQEVGAGSGFFVSPDGLILTNKHVVSDDRASYTVVAYDGKTYSAKVLAKDPINDLAIVKVDINNTPYLNLADSSSLQIGQQVIAIGNSLGQYQNTVTSGIISGMGRSITAGGDTGYSEDLSGVIQTDAAINLGNSGGPLLNLSGQVIGINTAIDQQGQLVGFAIPSNDMSKALASFKKNGKITRPFLGVRYLNITQTLAEQENLPVDYGALIVRGQTATDLAVQPGSPADKAGLVENDIILEINGQKLDKNHSLADLIKGFNVGDKLSLKIYHKGSEKTVVAVLGESK